MLGVSQCDLHTATSNQHSSRSPEVAAGSVAGIHPNQRHPRGAVDRISPSRELKGRVRETYDVDFTEAPPTEITTGLRLYVRGGMVIFVLRPPTSIFMQEYPEGVRNQCSNV